MPQAIRIVPIAQWEAGRGQREENEKLPPSPFAPNPPKPKKEGTNAA